MTDNQEQESSTLNTSINDTVTESGAYEVIFQRLQQQGKTLNNHIEQLNQERLNEFQHMDMTILSRINLRTDNNCEARDLVQIGNQILFGYNVFLGLRKETKIDDVFSLYHIKSVDNKFELINVPLKDSFLVNDTFLVEFKELYSYYKNAYLTQLVRKDNLLLAAFQIGDKLTDIRVFRWNIHQDGSIDYIDNRGERDIQLPPTHDFEWIECDHKNIVEGRHPHINILDTVFIDTLDHHLTIKVEDNTDNGEGIYTEEVDDATQSLDDAEFFYSQVGALILIKVKPYREEHWRYLIFNTKDQSVTRLDSIGDSCIQLPEDHGLIFPEGYFLTTSEFKTFNHDYDGLKFKRMIKSPNGEDVLFIFYQPKHNVVALFAYNLINQSMKNPIFGHGYGIYPDGKLVVFYAEEEATRIHPIQIWQTPFYSEEYASQQSESDSFYGKIGNAELVRGISELFAIVRLVDKKDVSSTHFQDVLKRSSKIFDNYYWLKSKELETIASDLKDVSQTCESIIDEYEKVKHIRENSEKQLLEAETDQEELLDKLQPDAWDSPQLFAEHLQKIKEQRGHLLTIKEYRYINLNKVHDLEQTLLEKEKELNEKTLAFLSQDNAFVHYHDELEHIIKDSGHCKKLVELEPFINKLEQLAEGLDLLSELVSSLPVTDATIQTHIVDAISEFYARLNQQKAVFINQQESFRTKENSAQFSARFRLLEQSIQSAMNLCKTPERCDEELSKLLIQLDELESQFGESEQYLSEILSKRDDIFESFESHKQFLLDEQQKKIQSLFNTGTRVLESIQRRTKKLNTQDELNTFFSSDTLVLRINELCDKLRTYDDTVKAETLLGKLKASKELSLKMLRDKADIYEEGGQVIKLGPRHKFSVNSQELDVTIIHREDALYVHLTGTDFFEKINHPEIDELKPFWHLSLYSETEEIYRGEYLSYSIIQSALENKENLTWSLLTDAVSDKSALKQLISQYIVSRYQEGYEKGIHDHDAALLLEKLIDAYNTSGALKYPALARAVAVVFWANHKEKPMCKNWPIRARNAQKISNIFSSNTAIMELNQEIASHLEEFTTEHHISVKETTSQLASEYLVVELGKEQGHFVSSKYADSIVHDFKLNLETQDLWKDYQKALKTLNGDIGKQWLLTSAWLNAFIISHNKTSYKSFLPEAIALLNTQQHLAFDVQQLDIQLNIEHLLGQHPRIQQQTMTIELDDYLERLAYHKHFIEPGYHKFQKMRQHLIQEQRNALRIKDFIPRPLTSFVRNQLINQAYLPIIGDNLAKQLGTVGDKKRTDLMGLLIMISPPGYGKTTLMEYIASRLGLIFMRINCPAIGHHTTSVDPEQADNSSARQELEKLNLAFEMGNNVMLYLDDIQHTNPEFLQQFISLCDGTRRIEGVWKNKAKTYDMRGKKFCVVMAGNPYTESGDVFKIPDMLANRADIYNLGDILGGQDDIFHLSYIENALTSNAILAPLVSRSMDDIYRFIDMTKNQQTSTNELEHQYSLSEIKEITNILDKLFSIQSIISKVNQCYIASSAQDDRYRTEPPFKLQGSYRNMNKIAEKISASMTDDELEQLISDHYQGEAQLLTKSTEENLLKLNELRNILSNDEKQRWEAIKKEFIKNKAIGGSNMEAGEKIVRQLHELVNNIAHFKEILSSSQTNSTQGQTLDDALTKKLLSELSKHFDKLVTAMDFPQPKVEVINQPVPGIKTLLEALTDTMQNSLLPLIKIMDGKLNIDLKTHEKMGEIEHQVGQLKQVLSEPSITHSSEKQSSAKDKKS